MFLKMQKHMLSVLVLLFYAITLTNSIKCYICGFNAYEPFQNLDNQQQQQQSRSCRGLHSNKSLDFIMECPPTYMGCITQINGTKTTRTCDLYVINDCQIANGVKYCYCSTDLCNGIDSDEDIITSSSSSSSSSSSNAKETPLQNASEETSLVLQKENSNTATEKNFKFSMKLNNAQNQSGTFRLTFEILCFLLISLRI